MKIQEFIINTKIFKCYYSNQFFWFRLFDKGIKIRNIKKHPLLFTERYKLRKKLLICNICFTILKLHSNLTYNHI